MYFKGMQLQGFKSFADKTVLDFKGGVTAVVGPNGSGKSNISDAIRWVMGETSAKSLRGSKMEDVIFCGSERRKPLGFAEVTIIMDNSDRSLNIDFSEVSVTRRVYRSGESEYMINKSPCRLRDIHELFMDTGLGRDGYSIIGQGKIDAILSQKSDERRHIFDEAAGITKYRYRKNEAEKKLADTQENLTRVGDIINELEDRVEPLRRQSEKAMQFIKLRGEQKETEVNLWLKSIDEGKTELEEVAGAYETVHGQIDDVNKSIANVEREINYVKDKIRLKESETDRAKSEMYKNRDFITKTQGEIEVLETSIGYNSQNALRLEGEIEFAEKRKNELKEIFEENTRAQLQAEKKFEEINVKIKETETRLSAVNEEIMRSQEMFAAEGDEINRINSEISETSAKLAANAQNISNAESRKQQIEAEYAEAEEKCAKMSDEISDIKNTVKKLEKECADAEKKADEKAQELEKAEKNHTAWSDRIQILDSENKTAISRKRILEDLENDFEGYSKPVKAVMNEHKFGSLSKCSIYGPISSLIKVDSKYTTAIEAALGGAMNNLAVETEEDAKAAIEYLKAGKKGRVTFMPVTSVKGRRLETDGVEKCKGYLGIASDIPKADGKFSQIIDSLLGKTVVVDNIDNGIAMARKYKYSFKIATLQGEIINAGGSISGGSTGTASGGLSRRNEIKELAAQIEKNTEKLSSETANLALLKKEIAKLKTETVKAQQEMWESKRYLAEYTTSQEHQLRAFADLENNMKHINGELEREQRVISQAEILGSDLKNRLEKLNGELTEKAEGHSAVTENISALRQEYLDINQKLGEMRVLQAGAGKDTEVCRERADETGAELARLSGEIDEKRQLHNSSETENKENRLKIEQKKKELEVYHKNAEESRKLAEEIGNERIKLDADLDKKQETLKEYNSTIFKLQSEEGRLEAKKVKLETEQENLISKMWEEYELTYSAAQEMRHEAVVISVYQKKLTDIKMQIRALGNINLGAIEEYKTTKERYEFLKEQQTDILKAKTELETLIAEMITVMSEMFEKNFAKLSAKFAETFSELFGGGRASLKLSDPENILESGVDIEVQPPGKNLQNINLLSGGEKAFTAIALIFAILKINPTHFCIFDEIEAALDDVNVFRFADFLKNLSNRTQFIVITHRKGTMEAADTLYGVTMQEKGVTSLLSLDLGEVEE